MQIIKTIISPELQKKIKKKAVILGTRGPKGDKGNPGTIGGIPTELDGGNF